MYFVYSLDGEFLCAVRDHKAAEAIAKDFNVIIMGW